MEYSVQLTLRQEWVDERLAYNNNATYKSYNISTITLTDQERIWKPDLFFRNEKEGHFHKIIMPNVLVRINGTGFILYSIRISLVLACPMVLKYYPLDKQNCTIEMASYGYTDSDLKFIWRENDPVQIPKISLPRFALERSIPAYCTSKTSTGVYSCLRVDLIFKREFSYYLIQIYIPCCMLVIVSWVSFWLDPNAIPARVSLGVTTLLTMATQISGINASLPPVSYTKAIDVWTGVCLTFVFGALLEFALVNYASRSDAHIRMQQARQEEMLRQRELELNMQRRQQMVSAAAAVTATELANPYLASAAIHQQQCNSHAQAQQLAYQQQQQQQQQQLGQRYARHGPHYGQKFPLNRSATEGYQTADIKAANGARHANGTRGLSPTNRAIHAGNGQQQQYGSNVDSANNEPSAPTQQQQQQQGNANTSSSNKQQMLPNGLMAINSFQLNNGAVGKSAKQQCEIHSILQRPSRLSSMPRRAESAARHCKNQVNFCRAWLNKFPSRSKRIDVISRIFFPLMFSLFNLVYWTTYLFREDDIVSS